MRTIKKAILDGDFVAGFVTGDLHGEPIPDVIADVPPENLRFVGGQIVDVTTRSDWHIDGEGRKHAEAGSGRQPLSCNLNDTLVRVGGIWRVQTASEAISPLIKVECQRRIFAVASANTQMNLTAARAAGRLSSGDAAIYDAGLDWIDDMRERCAELIQSASTGFREDGAWPSVPSGLVDLANRY